MSASAPRLRIERLVIVESRSPVTLIRDVRLHAGLNIVWAEELAAADGGTEVHRAGHGVGKSTFSLMVRAVLGDDGTAVKTMRNHLADHYGSGGIAAEVVAGADRFAVFRSFGSQSFALKGATVEGLFEEDAKAQAIEFSDYVGQLGEEACLQHMSTRALPVTGQPIEWGHVLCWIARDQALGLRQYFEWRNDDGTGLRRKVKDPPALTRLVLGLLSDTEAKAEGAIVSINAALTTARERLRREEQRGANTRAIVEAQLRTWAGVSTSLQMVGDDLFADSVEQEIRRKTDQLEAKNGEDRATIATIDLELIDLAADIKRQTAIVELAKGRWDEAIALRDNDSKALAEIRGRRDLLLQLVGTCQYGGVSYADCSHVQAQRDVVQLTAKRDTGVLAKTVAELEVRAASDKANYHHEEKVLAEFTAARSRGTERKSILSNGIEKRLRQLGESDSIRRTLSDWQESQNSPDTEKVRLSRASVVELEARLETSRLARVSAQQQVSERERDVGARFAKLADVFGATGRYESADEKRPFHMLRADGDAYTVLEILLGDLACAADGVDGAGAHPGLLIFDCPREREMSPQLYDRFLKLVHEVCTVVPGLQVLLTTTTPPPGVLRDPPTRILKLSHASDEDLLLKRRIENLLARVTPSARDEVEA